jgi:hypothetical protein
MFCFRRILHPGDGALLLCQETVVIWSGKEIDFRGTSSDSHDGSLASILPMGRSWVFALDEPYELKAGSCASFRLVGIHLSISRSFHLMYPYATILARNPRRTYASAATGDTVGVVEGACLLLLVFGSSSVLHVSTILQTGMNDITYLLAGMTGAAVRRLPVLDGSKEAPALSPGPLAAAL